MHELTFNGLSNADVGAGDGAAVGALLRETKRKSVGWHGWP